MHYHDHWIPAYAGMTKKQLSFIRNQIFFWDGVIVKGIEKGGLKTFDQMTLSWKGIF